jgi:hypothetical protein
MWIETIPSRTCQNSSSRRTAPHKLLLVTSNNRDRVIRSCNILIQYNLFTGHIFLRALPTTKSRWRERQNGAFCLSRYSKPPWLISLAIQPRKLALMLCAHTHGSLHSLCLSRLLLRLMLALHLLLLIKGIPYDAFVGDLGCLQITI